MEKMDIMGFVSNARLEELKEIVERHKREDRNAEKHMREVFVNAGSVERLESDSFLLAAVQAMSMGFYTGNRVGVRRAYRYVEDIIIRPFTCTIIQEIGCGDGNFEYHVVNKISMKSLEGMSYDVNAKWGDAIVEIFGRYLNALDKKKSVYLLADSLRKLYNETVKET